MSERNPYTHQEGDETLSISFTNYEALCHKRNTFMYSFEDRSEGDHIFIASGHNERGAVGAYIWKLAIAQAEGHSIDDYHYLESRLGAIGCISYNMQQMPLNDITAFKRNFGRLPELDDDEDDEPQGEVPPLIVPRSPVPTFELTERHEGVIQRFGKSLNEITNRYPAWFWQEMSEPQDRPYPNRWV